MALSEEQKKIIREQISIDENSNRQIAKLADCGESAVRGLIKREGLVRGKISALVNRDIENIIIANEIETHKSALNSAEKRTFAKYKADVIYREALAMTLLERSMEAAHDILDKGTKTRVFMQGHGLGVTSPLDIEIPLEAADIEKIINTAVKGSLALGVIEPPGKEQATQDIGHKIITLLPAKETD